MAADGTPIHMVEPLNELDFQRRQRQIQLGAASRAERQHIRRRTARIVASPKRKLEEGEKDDKRSSSSHQQADTTSTVTAKNNKSIPETEDWFNEDETHPLIDIYAYGTTDIDNVDQYQADKPPMAVTKEEEEQMGISNIPPPIEFREDTDGTGTEDILVISADKNRAVFEPNQSVMTDGAKNHFSSSLDANMIDNGFVDEVINEHNRLNSIVTVNVEHSHDHIFKQIIAEN